MVKPSDAGLRRGRPSLRVLVAVVFVALAAAAALANRLGYVDRLGERLRGRAPRLALGDFPAGVVAPVDDVVKVPTRPVLVGLVPRGSVAPLLYAAGDGARPGAFLEAWAVGVTPVVFEREEALRRALMAGAERGGVDLAALPVSSVAMSASLLREAAPRVLLLLGRSRGQDVIGARAGVTSFAALAGRRVAVEERSAPWFLFLWSLSRAGLSLRDVRVVPLESSFEAGAALSAGRADAAVGLLGDVEPATRAVGGTIVGSTADAPQLVATVLVARGDFAARYPDAVRRVLRGALDANAAVTRDYTDAARRLGEAAPGLGDPEAAIRAAPPASLDDNLAFFGLTPGAPVTFHELYESAAALNQKLFGAPPAPSAEDTADLGALKYVASLRGTDSK